MRGIDAVLEHAERRSRLAVRERFDGPRSAAQMQRTRVTGIGVRQRAGREIRDEIKRGREKRAVRSPQNGEQRCIHLRQKFAGPIRELVELLDQRPLNRRHQRRAHPMTHHVADEDAGARVRKRDDVKEIAAERHRRKVAADETQRALVAARRVRKGRKLLRQKSLLNLARHLQIILDLGTLFAQLLGVTRQLFIGFLARGDVATHADDPDDSPPAVAQRHLRGGEPFQRAPVADELAPIDDRLAARHHACVVGRETLRDLRREKIEGSAADNFLGRPDAELLRMRQISEQVAPLGVLDEDRIRHVVDHTAQQVALVFEREVRLGAFHRVADGTHEQRGVEPSLHEIILRAFLHRPQRHRLVVHSAQHQNRRPRRMAMELAKRRDALAVRQRKIREHHLDVFAAEPLQCGREPRNFLHRKLHRRLGEHLADQQLIVLIVLHEEDANRRRAGCGIIHVHSIGRGLTAHVHTPASMTSRTLRASSAGVKGFCRKAVPGSRPWRFKMLSST